MSFKRFGDKKFSGFKGGAGGETSGKSRNRDDIRDVGTQMHLHNEGRSRNPRKIFENTSLMRKTLSLSRVTLPKAAKR